MLVFVKCGGGRCVVLVFVKCGGGRCVVVAVASNYVEKGKSVKALPSRCAATVILNSLYAILVLMNSCTENVGQFKVKLG